jgi:hypothetical protein
MDAMQKRRIYKVAIAYFILSTIILCRAFNYGAWDAPLKEDDNWFIAWKNFWVTIVLVLQPFSFLVSKPLPSVFAGIIWLISIPAWSLCFGWLYVKFTNWLNHFPVLGKKVF